MNNRSKFLLLSISVAFLLTFTINNSFSLPIQDLTCQACVTISDTKSLETHKSLPLPIMLWAENFDYVYDHNSIIKINGYSKLNNPDTPILVTVTDPIGNVVTVDQLLIKPNSNFQLKFNTASDLWKKDGLYIIKAQGGSQGTVFKTGVEVISTGIGSKAECTSKEITVTGDNGGRYCIPFTTTGQTPSNLKSFGDSSLSVSSKLLSIHVNSLDIQSIILDIDKKLLDSKTPTGANNPFNILLNGKTVKVDELESKLPNYRTLSIPIPRGESVIEITGTHVIPEFGSIALIILVVAIISAIVLTNKKIPLLNNFSKY